MFGKNKSKSKKAAGKSSRRPVTKKDAEYDNTLRGVLFENDRKEKDSHPDYKGSFTDADGNEYWLSAWEKESRDGQEYLSIAATPKEDQEEEGEEGEEGEEDERPAKTFKRKK